MIVRCQECQYDLTGHRALPLCPECGATPDKQDALLAVRREDARILLATYVVLAGIMLLPVPVLAINVGAGVLWNRAWPWQHGWHVSPQNDDFPILDVTAGLFILGIVAQWLIWPCMLALACGLILFRRRLGQPTRAVFILVLLSGTGLIMPALWFLIRSLLVFPD